MSCIPYIYIRTRAREVCGSSGRRNTLQMSRLAIIFFLIFFLHFYVGASGSWVSAPLPVPRFAAAPMHHAPMHHVPMHGDMFHVEHVAAEPPSRRAAEPPSRRAAEPMRHVSSV